jgi:arylsulfatase
MQLLNGLKRSAVSLTGLILGVLWLGPLAAQDRPNFLIIWGDDIGIYNLSAYNDGAMGYRTPNIDRIAAEGVRFTDYYGDQSCTAGRSSFITGPSAAGPGLCDRAVRQEPPGGQGRVSAHQPRFR